MSAKASKAGAAGDDEYADDFDPVCNMGHAQELTAQKVKIDALTAQVTALELKLKSALATAILSPTAASASAATAAAPASATNTPLGRRRIAGSDSKSAAAPALNLSDYRLREVSLTAMQIGEQIAGGGFCTLHRGVWQGVTVAVKKIFDPVITAELRAEFTNECAMLSNLRHPNVVQILAQCSSAPTLAIVTEFMARGSLYHVLHNDSKLQLPNERKRALALHIANGLCFVAASGVVHRDIKSYNILVDEHLRAKVGDFGLARVIAELPAPSAASDELAGGTPAYLAPELWGKPSALPSAASDVYAFGILLWELWERTVPFDGYSVPDIRTKVLAGGRPSSSSANEAGYGLPKKPSQTGTKCNAATDNMPDVVIDLIAGCWDAAPAKRPTFPAIVQALSNLKL